MSCQNTTLTVLLGWERQHKQCLLPHEKVYGAVSDHVSTFIELTEDQEESSNHII